jgi:hypothetical protein
MSFLQTLGAILFVAVVVGYPIHRMAVRREQERAAAMAPDLSVVESAHVMAGLDAEWFDLSFDEGGWAV